MLGHNRHLLWFAQFCKELSITEKVGTTVIEHISKHKHITENAHVVIKILYICFKIRFFKICFYLYGMNIIDKIPNYTSQKSINKNYFTL